MVEQSTLTSLKFDTNLLPEKQQYAFFREQLFDSAGLEVDRPGPADNPFSLIAEYNRTPKFWIYRYQCNTPCFFHRSERGMVRTEMNAFGVHYRIKGEDLSTPLSEGLALTRTGDLRSLDTERTFFYQHKGVTVYTLNLNRKKVSEEVPGISQLHNMVLSDSPVTRILKTAITGVFRELKHADDREIETLSDTLYRLTVDAFRHQWIQELETREIRDETVLCTIVDFIHRNFYRRDLTPEMIAKAIGISRSKLYQICQQMDAPQRLIRLIRLEKAASLLRADANCNIGDVAYKTGFSTRPAFSRAFMEHYGVSPTDYREGLRERKSELQGTTPPTERDWERLRASLQAAALG
ncbi:helix-turn-helix transcriptional regulator [Rhodobacteraceae bacterium B1Z28]|uniref:Helix-turn-helix transcriptional regulator n=1 Tax=Ruegeria haliotis TaxID=2747601 RepID=A0ABX2PWF1_9RHOB|nr:AraC family transcriptional regulator [Ruegeria haliotis]NVO58109.1 helix-turn-helix transcriptional regulator [Ruegeria haliotis]